MVSSGLMLEDSGNWFIMLLSQQSLFQNLQFVTRFQGHPVELIGESGLIIHLTTISRWKEPLSIQGRVLGSV
ncbi:MAG: hypothetical protein EZS28_020851 [Streblomastix strix]|uniref:Uncharacterized protein n=1 Tax=Streblomastix strix TaxID=222440 RepID=A0A5J4VM15_9EUKA|nr:MAG: hypothetical protein EZS28_020851 [Streblomastix strix]